MRTFVSGFTLLLLAAAGLFIAPMLLSQPPGFGGPRGPGGPVGPNTPDQEIVERFDKDKDGRLGRKERIAARRMLQSQASSGQRRGPGGPRGGPGRGGNREPATPGEHIDPTQVTHYPEKALYDPTVLRTLFLDFESDDWEAELAAFKPTDVQVPAKLTVDGSEYPDVGVSFRGASSFFMVPEGSKRSLNVSVNYVNKDQRLCGYKTLNLLNCNGDSSMLSSVLYSSIARHKIAAPKANLVKVVINGESWGIYCNVQQFNKDFLDENYGTKKGTRWKVPGNPRADGGLRFLGEDVEQYRERFEIKSKDNEASWQSLIHLCRVLNETPAEQLEDALAPILDIDGALWFLAVDVALVNSDGYWTRASDYSIYKEPDGKFHLIPHDMNESFRGSHRGPGGPGGGPGGRRGPPGFGPPGGFGFGPPPGFGPPAGREGPDAGSPPPERRAGRLGEQRGRGQGQERRAQGRRGRGPGGGRPGGGGVDLDPLVGLDDPSKPLRSKLLANKNLRAKYLEYVRIIAEELLDWDNFGPQVAQMRALVKDEVAKDTKKLSTTEAFLASTSSDPVAKDEQPTSLRAFAEKRAAYLLSHDAIKRP